MALFFQVCQAIYLRDWSSWVFRAIPSFLVEECLQVVAKFASLFFWLLKLFFFLFDLDQNVIRPFCVLLFLLLNVGIVDKTGVQKFVQVNQVNEGYLVRIAFA